MADEPKTYTQEEVDKLVAEQTAGLKANRDELKKEAATAKARLAGYDGVDPEEFKRLKAASEEADRKKAAAEGDFKSLEKQMAERHQAELAAKEGRIGKLNKALEKRLIDAQLTTHLAEQGAKPEFLRLLKLEGARYLKVVETDDDYVEQVIDPASGARLVADGNGTPMSVADLIGKTLKTQYPDAFTGTGSSGGGAAKSNAGGGGGASKTIAAGDMKALLDNAAGIAKGEVQVR